MIHRLLKTATIPMVALLIGASAAQATLVPTQHPQRTWAPVGRLPLSDKKAASYVTREPEVRPANQAMNRYRPTNLELQRFRTARGRFGLTPLQQNPLNAYVTGRTNLHQPTTDMIIQWAAHKWGIPEDLLRAQAWFEANWRMNWPGDLTVVPKRWYFKYPPQVRTTGWRVWESMGTMQIKWTPDEANHTGTARLRWVSTAFNLDYAAATIRYFYDGRCTWAGRNYHAGQKWLSIAAWNRPVPWGNPRMSWYIAQVKDALAHHYWTQL